MTAMPRVTAEVHKQIEERYRVKVSIHDDGMYINGFMVFPPDEEHEWSVYPPSLKVFGRYIYLVEYDKSKQLWNEIFEACINAVEVWKVKGDGLQSQEKTVKASEAERVYGVRPKKTANVQDIEYL